MESKNLIMISEENLHQLVAETSRKVINEIKATEWVTPEEAERLMGLKRQTILKLWQAGELDVTWPGADNARIWLASRTSIGKYLERKKNYNRR